VTRGFRSESVHKVDRKGRVSVPAAFRRVLEEGDPDWTGGQNPNLVLVYGGPGGKCLEGYSIDGIAAIDAKISRLPTFSKKRKALERWLNTQSVFVQLDDTGRIVLSARLREMMDIDAEAVFAGMGQKFEVWAPEGYAADMQDIDTWTGTLPEGESPFDALDALDAGGGI
jgi:MraZ protein